MMERMWKSGYIKLVMVTKGLSSMNDEMDETQCKFILCHDYNQFPSTSLSVGGYHFSLLDPIMHAYANAWRDI